MDTPFETIDKTFKNKTINLDGRHFQDCRFIGCEMVYQGGLPPVLRGCNFSDCRWSFGNEAANTLGFLSGFYNGGFADLVESTFHGIRRGDFMELPLPRSPDETTSTPPVAPNEPHPLAKRVPRLFRIAKNKSD